MDSPDGTVSSLDVINASADLEKRMNITHAEELIKRLLKDKWMSEVSLSFNLYEMYPHLNKKFWYKQVHISFLLPLYVT